MSVTDPILQAIHRVILEEPFSDLHRLAYADRCEELGEDARAEFIRVQCELAKPCRLGYSDAYHVDDDCPACDLLHRRERELLMPHAEAWAVSGLDAERWGATSDAKGVSLYHWENLQYGPVADVAILFRRGFVEEAQLILAAFESHARALFVAHPITKVMLTDRHPKAMATGNRYGWYCCLGDQSRSSNDFPSPLWNLLDGGRNHMSWKSYPTPKAAHAALFRACVAYGRQLVGIAVACDEG